MKDKTKFVVIGLDCVDPVMLFEAFVDVMPHTQSLLADSVYGRLESTIPPITVPAWISMFTSKDAGTLGLYGFRNRKDYSYDKLMFANSTMLREKAVWDFLAEKHKKSILLGIPMTYPPRAINGYMVTSFLTPDVEHEYTYPPELAGEIKSWVGEYMLDVPNFRTDDKERLLQAIYIMTEKRFKVAHHLLTEKPWDLFIMVEMGPDRVHHGFWAYYDETHPKHDPQSPFKTAIRDYYKFLDEQIGLLLQVLPDDAVIMLTSDHGVKKMTGGICLNEWLIENDYLKLKAYPDEPQRMGEVEVDWPQSRAWGFGGYYGRLFMNVEGREPTGIIPRTDYEKVRQELIDGINSIPDEFGQDIGSVVFRPEEIYRQTNNIPPDLIIYFGNLDWRSIGSIGRKTLWMHENDTGPDDANHAQFGIYSIKAPGLKPGRQDASIYDIAPTILQSFAFPTPPDFIGKSIL